MKRLVIFMSLLIYEILCSKSRHVEKITRDIYLIFRGLFFSHNAEIGRKGRKSMGSSIVLVVMFISQLVYGAASEDGPLTLMKDPKQSVLNSSGQPLPHMSAQQQGQGQGQGQGQALELYDIYGVVPTKAAIPYLYIILGTLLVLIAGALLYWWWKKRAKRVFTPIISPWERAITDLNEAKSLQNREQGRAYMDRVSQILRHYIEQRFAIKSTRQTTGEFLYSLSGEKSSELTNYRPELQNCLEQADMAKFAHKEQDEQNLVVMEEAVTTFVHSTRSVDGGKEANK